MPTGCSSGGSGGASRYGVSSATQTELVTEIKAGTGSSRRTGDGPPAQDLGEERRVTTRRKGPSSPKKNRRTNADRWRDVGEWLALILKVLVYLAGLAVTLSGYGCGPN